MIQNKLSYMYLLLLILSVSCSKDRETAGPSNEKHAVTFRVSNLQVITEPLAKGGGKLAVAKKMEQVWGNDLKHHINYLYMAIRDRNTFESVALVTQDTSSDNFGVLIADLHYGQYDIGVVGSTVPVDGFDVRRGLAYMPSTLGDLFSSSTEFEFLDEPTTNVREIELQRSIGKLVLDFTALPEEAQSVHVRAVDEYNDPAYWPYLFSYYSGSFSGFTYDFNYTISHTFTEEEHAAARFVRGFFAPHNSAQHFAVEIYNWYGELMNRVIVHDVPIQANRATILRGDPYSTRGGVYATLDPDWQPDSIRVDF
ncbi:hypothetical protein [Olivibacter sp. XZL3]|uniref:hypothetical protein n=1 Tax=Olivibacter sp. XZL3 TaxID=1735116 RepID=UPI00106549BE|nr:hypothetical protein [Olivibacter sp. XZL3]